MRGGKRNPVNHINPVKKYITVTDDEKPFDLPKGWEWRRLGEVGEWGAGATPSRKNPEYYKDGKIPWLKTGDLNDGVVTCIPESITEKALAETSVRLNPIGSVMMAMYGATIGRVGILGIEATTNQACCVCRVNELVDNRYLFYYLMSQREQFKRLGGGGAQPNISKELRGDKSPFHTLRGSVALPENGPTGTVPISQQLCGNTAGTATVKYAWAV